MEPIQVNIDFSGLAQLVVNAFVDGMRNLFAPLPHDFEVWLLQGIQALLASSGGLNVLTHVPTEWTTENGDVLSLYRQGFVAELGISTVVTVIQGYRVMHGSIDVYEAVFRTAFFVMMGMLVSVWLHPVLVAVNALSDAVSTSHMDIRSESLPNDLVIGFALIVAVILGLFAWIKGAVGVVFIDVLIVSAPYFLTASALPLFEGLGKWWAEELTTWVLRGFMVALVLRLGLGIASANPGAFEFLFAVVTFWLAYTMDTRIRRFSVGAWGSVSQLGLFARGARMAAGAMSGGTAAPAAAAAAAAP